MEQQSILLNQRITSTNVTTSGGVLTTNPTTFAENDTIVASVNAAGTGGTGAKVYIYLYIDFQYFSKIVKIKL